MTPYTAAMDPSSLNLLQIFGLLIGGLALFLLGLEFMTGGLKAIAGSRLQALLGMLTASRFRGVLAGAVVTALLNSSTITTVLMVGFVSSGLMTLTQSVPMIMGANIGSTVTAQIIAGREWRRGVTHAVRVSCIVSRKRSELFRQAACL